jgi:ribonuclease HI
MDVGAGVVLIPPEGDVLKYTIQLEFSATNNIAEYEGASQWPSAS